MKKYTGIFKDKIDVLDASINKSILVMPTDIIWALSKPGEYELTPMEAWLQSDLGKEKYESILDTRQSHFIKKYKYRYFTYK